MTTVNDYLLDPDKQDWPRLLAGWRTILPYEFSIWLMNRFGDLFLVASDEAVHRLDVVAGTLTKVADNWEDFSRKIDEGTNAEDWLRPSLVDALVAAGLVLPPGRCYGLRVPPSLGGSITLDNIVARPIADHFIQLAPGGESASGIAVDDTPMSIKVDYRPHEPSSGHAPGKKPEVIKVEYRAR